MRFAGLTALLALAACASADEAVTANETAPTNATRSPSADSPQTAETIATETGRYSVSRSAKIDSATLPQNADLKMLDGDLAKYAVKLCDLEFRNTLAPSRCDIFVQPDMSGNLIGYAVVKGGQEARISTVTTTNASKEGSGCFIDGVMENRDYDNPKAKIDTGKDFKARMMYAAWQRSPGDWMVAPVDGNEPQEAAIGVWYFERSGDKLRISRERWSYCYKDSSVPVDEVFLRALSLERTK